MQSDIAKVYHNQTGIAGSIKLTFASVYSNNFEKQRVSLSLDIFNGCCFKAQCLEETARFVELVLRMWNMLNVKSVNAGGRLNYPDRYAFYSADDNMIDFLKRMATIFKQMDIAGASLYTRVMGLTSDALHVTLLGICNIVQTLISKVWIKRRFKLKKECLMPKRTIEGLVEQWESKQVNRLLLLS